MATFVACLETGQVPLAGHQLFAGLDRLSYPIVTLKR